jgi:hypothetical protein
LSVEEEEEEEDDSNSGEDEDKISPISMDSIYKQLNQ